MPSTGDAPRVEDYDRLVSEAFAEDGVRYWQACYPEVDEIRDHARQLTDPGSRGERRPAFRVNVESAPRLLQVGQLLAWEEGLREPWHGLVHRDMPLAYHRDTQHPYPCTNLTLVLAEGCDGGALVLAGRRLAFACQDRYAMTFDGQELHGLLPFTLAPDGYRCALTFYCPKGEA